MKELSSRQNYLFNQIKYWVSKNKEFKIREKEESYYSFNSGKRFYSFRFSDDGKTFFGIREDGNSRYVFNGRIETFEDFKRIDDLTK